MARNGLELSDIIRKYGHEFRQSRSLSKKQKSVLSAIELCRTEHLGYHLDECTVCNHQEISYNSCRDRHCPKCQGIAQRKWVERRTEQLLPVPYYHVVFTLPAGLFPFSLYNKELIYNLLFESAAATLKEFGRDPRWLGGNLGFFGILHTWGQTLWHHPHLHFIVAGGGLKEDGSWVYPKHKGKFLFPVRGVSKVFRGKFMRKLENAITKNVFELPSDFNGSWQPERFLQSLVTKDWIVYCKVPFKKAKHVVRYIGRYTHRVALSNSRLIGMYNDTVKFTYRDYRDNKKRKDMKLKVDDFLQRFVWHILPEKFHRIRHFGFLANGTAQRSCERIRKILGIDQEISEDRFEEKSTAFHQQVRLGYLQIAESDSNRIHIVDGRGEIETVQQEIRTVVLKRIEG